MIESGKLAKLKKRRTGEVKGNPYMVLAVIGNKAKLRGANTRDDKFFNIKDLV
jgi:hypothetical protein